MHEERETRSGGADGLDERQVERLRELVYDSLSCEFTTVRDGKPATYPITPLYDADRGTLVVSSPPAFAGKVENVEHDPRVALLFHDDEGEYLVTGEGRIRDADPEASAEYVADRMLAEPETHKRRVHEDAIEGMDSLLGRLVMGWYALRVVVEVEPVSMRRLGEPSPVETLPAWDAAGMDAAEASRYQRATLSMVGPDGYPVTRPVTRLDVRDGAAVPEPEPPDWVDDGQPACLLAHWHDDRCEDLGQRVVRGRFRTGGGSSSSTDGASSPTGSEPPRFVPGSSFELWNEGILDTIRFIVDGKRRTRAYFRD